MAFTALPVKQNVLGEASPVGGGCRSAPLLPAPGGGHALKLCVIPQVLSLGWWLRFALCQRDALPF